MSKQKEKLLPKYVLRRLPQLRAQEEVPDPIVAVKFFTPDAQWTWYATEGSPEGEDFMFFGFVVGEFPEWGYFALSELLSIRGGLGLPVERDLYLEPMPLTAALRSDGLDRVSALASIHSPLTPTL